MELIYFDTFVDSYYPVGSNIMSNIPIIEAYATNIDNIIDKGKSIALICRGTSGTILSGGVACFLKQKKRNVKIIISRKGENHHGYNMEGISCLKKETDRYASVVIDDFISSGNTLDRIIADLVEENVKGPYDLLCISNKLDLKRLRKKIDLPMYYLLYNNLHKFNKILCNKVIEDDVL